MCCCSPSTPTSVRLELTEKTTSHNAARSAWHGHGQGRPRVGALVLLLSIVLFVTTIQFSEEAWLANREVVGLRAAAIGLVVVGSWLFLWDNLSWARMWYTGSSPQGLIVMFYCVFYLGVGLAAPDEDHPVASSLEAVYMTLSIVMWLCLESAKQVRLRQY